MITRRKPIVKSHIRPKEFAGIVGGEYIFEYAGKVYVLSGRFVNDPKSVDGQRWIGTRESNRIIRKFVYDFAQGQCEMRNSSQCWKWAPLAMGHPHHVIHKKMGGSQTDDRIWVAGERIRVWACWPCHRNHHGEPEWSRKIA